MLFFGTGIVGNAIAKDLNLEQVYDITAIDINQSSLDKLACQTKINIFLAGLQKAENNLELIAHSDLVINAVPGTMGFETLKTIIEAGKNVVDISFFGEDAFKLDDLAKEKVLPQ